MLKNLLASEMAGFLADDEDDDDEQAYLVHFNIENMNYQK